MALILLPPSKLSISTKSEIQMVEKNNSDWRKKKTNWWKCLKTDAKQFKMNRKGAPCQKLIIYYRNDIKNKNKKIKNHFRDICFCLKLGRT